jgi:uncharacterized protein
MELTNEFTVGVPVEQAWAVLTDVERIAPCMPGAQLQEIEGDEYRGIVKVKVGPITAQYKGAATFVEKDDSGHRAVLRAEGRETRGQGNASATITATLVPAGDGTQVTVLTDLTVTGRVAQFGRGVLADVSAKLLGQFVSCLETTVLGDGAGADDASAPAGAAAPDPGSPGAGDAATSPAGPAAATTTGAPSPAPARAGASDSAAADGSPAPDASSPASAGSEPGPSAESAPAADGDGPAAGAPVVEDRTPSVAAAGPVDAGPSAAGTAASPVAPAAGPSASPATATASTGARRIDHPEAEPVDLLDVAGASVGRRLAPVLAVVAAVLVFLRLRRRRR